MRSFCSAKASHIVSTKNIGIIEKITSENLTKLKLTTWLVLNNRALVMCINKLQINGNVIPNFIAPTVLMDMYWPVIEIFQFNDELR